MRILALLRLFRVANIGTAISNVLMGYLLVRGDWLPWHVVLLAVCASCVMYTAGMVLNDVFDIQEDRHRRAERPLPSGQVALEAARVLGFSLLGVGVVLGLLLTLLAMAGERSGALACASVAISLAACILLYDGRLKRTLLGPPLMGACRSLNVLLGMAAAASAAGASWLYAAHWLVAMGAGVYVCGITLLARDEAGISRRGPLIVALAVMSIGVALMGVGGLDLIVRRPEGVANLRILFPVLLLLVCLPVLGRGMAAVALVQPQHVQRAVAIGLTTIIPLDAVLCIAGQPKQTVYAVVVVLLLIPTIVMRRWVQQT